MIGLLATTFAGVADLACAECHETETAQWRDSRHAKATSNPIFQASWRNWPNGWCLACHAPGEQQQMDLLGHVAVAGILQRIPETAPGTSWRDGVDCVACHVRGDALLTTSEPSAAGEAVHILVQDEAFGSGACASCHQFPFQERPDYPFRYGTTLAQATYDEWLSSQAHEQGLDCIDCHMGSAGHRFPGAHSPAMVREALVVTTRREGGMLQVSIAAQGVGHAVPTGDPFRRLILQLCRSEACEDPEPVAWFKRHTRPTETGWRNHDDSRIPVDGMRRVEVPLGRARWWRLIYRFGDRRFEPDLPASEVGYTVHEGPIPRRLQ